LKALDFLVVQEQFMTATAKFADIILPTNTYLERNDITRGTAFFYGYMNRAVDPAGESRSHYEIAVALAERLGVGGFAAKTEEEWLKDIVRTSGVIKDYDAFKKGGVHRVPRDGPYVSFTDEIRDPAGNPFPTPTGKIEIFSGRIAEMANPQLPPIPKYFTAPGDDFTPAGEEYPLRLVTTHYKLRAHTQFHNIPWLRETEIQAVTVHPRDADTRGIKNGAVVRVFNAQGAMLIPARVSERIMPGVVDIPQGAWYQPDADGVDRGGCVNVLSLDQTSPCGSFVTNGIPVQITRHGP
jgi:anaerobic dimethyl sulfoxide reductase subunit A